MTAERQLKVEQAKVAGLNALLRSLQEKYDTVVQKKAELAQQVRKLENEIWNLKFTTRKKAADP